MRATLRLLAGGGLPIGKYNNFLGSWGNLGSPPQKGIITYGLSANRQNPFAGALNDAIFNTWRRFSSQFWFYGPHLMIGYGIMYWADENYKFRNSKAGMKYYKANEEEEE